MMKPMKPSYIFNSLMRRVRRELHFKTPKTSDAVHWGIIGLGNMAQVFAEALNGNAGSIITAVASRSIDKAQVFAKRNGVPKAYGSYESMLSDKDLQVDVIYVATPVKCHYDHVKMCLLAGKSVLCEKPATYSASEFSELMSLAEQNHCFLMEGMWMRCLPSYLQARTWLSEGKIGALKLVRADLYKREHIRPELVIYDPNRGGGVIRDYGVYAISLVESFLGSPTIVYSHMNRSEYGLDSDWQIYMENNGIQAFVNLSSVFDSFSKAILVGEKGSIEFGSQFNRTNHISLFAKDGKLIETKRFTYRYDGFEYEIDHVNNLIRLGRLESDLVSKRDTFTVLQIIDQLVANYE